VSPPALDFSKSTNGSPERYLTPKVAMSPLSSRLYKYLDVSGARLTLRNRNFKHSKPSEFNDRTDMTIERLFPEADETTLAAAWSNFTDIIVKNVDKTPTCANEAMRNQLSLLQEAFRQYPEKIEFIKAQAKEIPISELYDLNKMSEWSSSYVAEINDFLQQYRILCVSETPDNMQMWCRYAQAHEGIVLRITPNLQKDTKFARFRAVNYYRTRPSLYDDPIRFLEGGLFGDQNGRTTLIMDRTIYAKTLDWAYEREQRLVIPISGEDWNVMPYHPEEITELFLGAKMHDDVKREMVKLAEELNPEISIFQAVKGSTGVSFFLV
jgi:hypothetical protein